MELTKYNLQEEAISSAPVIEQWAFFFLVRGPVRGGAVAGVVAGCRVSARDFRGRSDRGQNGGSDDVRPAFEGPARLSVGIGQAREEGLEEAWKKAWKGLEERPGKRRSGRKNSNSPTASRRTVEFHRKSSRTNDRRIVHNSGGSAAASAVSRILTKHAHLPDSFPVFNYPIDCALRVSILSTGERKQTPILSISTSGNYPLPLGVGLTLSARSARAVWKVHFPRANGWALGGF